MTETLAAIAERRVSRRFDERPVARDQLWQVLRAGWRASHAGNRRVHKYLVITSAQQISRLRHVAPGMLAVPPALIVICLDLDRVALERVNVERDSSVWIDVGTSAMTMMLAAQALHLGTCPATSFSPAGVAEVLRLPASALPQLILQVGHPLREERPAGSDPEHLPRLKDFVYWETYGHDEEQTTS